MYSEWEYTETWDCCKEDYYLFYEYDPAPRPPKTIRNEGRMVFGGLGAGSDALVHQRIPVVEIKRQHTAARRKNRTACGFLRACVGRFARGGRRRVWASSPFPSQKAVQIGLAPPQAPGGGPSTNAGEA